MNELEEYRQYLLAQGQPESEVSEYMAYLESQNPKPTPQGGFEKMGLIKEGGPLPSGTWDVVRPILGKGLQAAGKVMDYAGGVARTAAVAPFTDKVEIDDVLNAFMAKPKSGDEILEALNAPKGNSLSDAIPSMYSETGEGLPLQKGGMLDPSTRGVAGVGVEVVSDPIFGPFNALTKKLLNKAGTTAYNSAFKQADRAAQLSGKGKNAVSSTMKKYGIRGGAEDIAEKAGDLADNLYRQQQQILKEAGERGATVDASRALKRTIKKADNIATGKNIKPVRDAAEGISTLAKDVVSFGSEVPASTVRSTSASSILDEMGRPILKEQVQSVPAKVAMTPLEASNIKSQMYGLMNENAYSILAKEKQGSKLLKDAARSIRVATEQAVSRADEELGKRLKMTNQDLGNILSSRKVLEREATKEIAKNSLTSVDAALLAASPVTAASKKLGDISKGSWFRTNAGLGLESAASGIGKLSPYKMLLIKEAMKQSGNLLGDQ